MMLKVAMVGLAAFIQELPLPKHEPRNVCTFIHSENHKLKMRCCPKGEHIKAIEKDGRLICSGDIEL